MSTSISKIFLGVSPLSFKIITVLGVETGFPPPSIMTEMTGTRDTWTWWLRQFLHLLKGTYIWFCLSNDGLGWDHTRTKRKIKIVEEWNYPAPKTQGACFPVKDGVQQINRQASSELPEDTLPRTRRAARPWSRAGPAAGTGDDLTKTPARGTGGGAETPAGEPGRAPAPRKPPATPPALGHSPGRRLSRAPRPPLTPAGADVRVSCGARNPNRRRPGERRPPPRPAPSPAEMTQSLGGVFCLLPT